MRRLVAVLLIALSIGACSSIFGPSDHTPDHGNHTPDHGN